MFKNPLNIIIFLLLVVLSIQNCEKGKNFCILCNLATDLCKLCESELFIPDETGGCKGAKKCYINQNHCKECSSSTHLCEECDDGYFPDDNGGCSLTKNCDVSENGNCKKCMENYILIYSGNNYMECESTKKEELLNCEEYDIYGHCNKCKEGFYLNIGDRKCSNTTNCLKSTGGVCEVCDYSFYLDKSNKTNYECLSNVVKNKFLHCSLSENGENCDLCLEPYYLSGDKKCVKTKYCTRGVTGTDQCSICDKKYYLSDDKFSCTLTQNCKNGYGDNGKCKLCLDGYYNDLNDGNCYSNTEDNIYKYCQTVLEKCESCIKDYYLGEDKKCSNSKNCSESELGICNKCVNNYYLGKLDNRCSKVENCIKSDYKYDCEECDDNYFLNNSKCINDDIRGDTFKNCKIVFNNQDHCSQCKNNYYLNEKDNLCYSNKDNYYKCSRVSDDTCTQCEELYFLGEDNKCSKISGCAISETPDKCSKCLPGLCKNNLKGTCDESSYIDENEKEDENNGVCFRCQETNEEGNKCIKCQDGYILSEKGFCMDEEHCEEKKNEKCVKCMQNVIKDGMLKSYCLNDRYGCVDSVEGCLQCNDIYEFNSCTKCFPGFYFDEDYGFCYECKDGCSSCTDYQNCGACKNEGFYTLDEATTPDTYDAICEQCIEGCKKCSNNIDCEICYEGYYLTNENPEGVMKCASCGLWCEECYDRNYCLKCFDGYNLVTIDDKIVCRYQKSN